MSPSSNTLIRAASRYDLVGDEMHAFSQGISHTSPHPQDPSAYCIAKPSGIEAERKYATLEFFLDDWTNPQSPTPIGAMLYDGKEDQWIGGQDHASLAMSLVTTLEHLGRDVSHLVVWNGRLSAFHAFLRHLARPLVALGATVQPLVSGVDIKAIMLKLRGRGWILTDLGVMSGASKIGQDAFCESLGAGYVQGATNVRSLYLAVGKFAVILHTMAGVALRATVAAASLAAAKLYLPDDTRWYRPSLCLESMCRYGGAYRGGYVHSEPYHGPAWRIDVNRMYTSLLRSKLPAHTTFGHAGKKGKEHPGFYLCRVEGQGHFPAYISAFHSESGRFHKQNMGTVSAWAFLPSAELLGLRRIGYDVTASVGFNIDGWIDLSGFANHLLDLQSRYERGSAESIVAKSLGNALTGKLGQSPERLDVIYSTTEPRGGWLPYVTVEREVIPDLWVKKHLSFAGGQHVDAAAWLTAMGRNKVYAQLARVKALGWRAVHVDTDGIMLDSDPRAVLALSNTVPGEWRYEGYDAEALVTRSKWYSFQGEQHTAGLAGVTREQLEAVHYGRKVVIGRKVLANPLTSSDTYRTQSYSFGG